MEETFTQRMFARLDIDAHVLDIVANELAQRLLLPYEKAIEESQPTMYPRNPDYGNMAHWMQAVTVGCPLNEQDPNSDRKHLTVELRGFTIKEVPFISCLTISAGFSSANYLDMPAPSVCWVASVFDTAFDPSKGLSDFSRKNIVCAEIDHAILKKDLEFDPDERERNRQREKQAGKKINKIDFSRMPFNRTSFNTGNVEEKQKAEKFVDSVIDRIRAGLPALDYDYAKHQVTPV